LRQQHASNEEVEEGEAEKEEEKKEVRL